MITISNETNCYVPFSKCNLWEKQKDFYRQSGIDAWNKIPFHITSNPRIANMYANIVKSFIQDTIHNQMYDASQPFYILELGAGSGTFSFYMLKELLALHRNLHLQQFKFVYVMTDFVKKNINFWQTHPNFSDYIKNGYLDFAIYDAEKRQSIKLLMSGKCLKDLKNPLIVIANYVFDSIRQDIFRIKDGKLQACLIKQNTDFNCTGTNVCIDLEQIDPMLQYEEVGNIPYYENKGIDSVLNDCRENYSGYFLFPIGVLQCIYRLRQLNNRLLLLTSDKSVSKQTEIESFSQYQPGIVTHDGAFSMMVNFHVLELYFKSLFGDHYHQNNGSIIKTSVFVLKNKFVNLPETKHTLDNFLDDFDRLNVLYGHIQSTLHLCSLETLIAYMENAQWDNYIFISCLPLIINRIENEYRNNLSTDFIERLKNGLGKVTFNFYYLPFGNDILYYVALLFHKLSCFQIAIDYYERSILHFGKSPIKLCNTGLCYYFLKKQNKALELLNEAISLDSSYILARGWINYIEERLAKNTI